MGSEMCIRDSREMPAAEALTAAGLKPVVLAAKEGLALINGTQVSTAFALAGLFGALGHARRAVVTSPLSTDAIMGAPRLFYTSGAPGGGVGCVSWWGWWIGSTWWMAKSRRRDGDGFPAGVGAGDCAGAGGHCPRA